MISVKRFLRESALARNTFWMLGGHGVRVVLQAIYFLLIARALGAAEYGAFVGAVSLMALVAPFSSWGTGFILIRKARSSLAASCFVLCFWSRAQCGEAPCHLTLCFWWGFRT
ncbi:MAG: hypothetical protein DMG96_10840 [Acidobacteria bacterium]|nr:MAG: hypothetical protein DMG96_10840 [Acidobacteriota bacterium]